MTILDLIVETKKEEISSAMRAVPESELRARIADTSWTSRSFEKRLTQPGPGGANIITEVKRASPSKGDICKDLDAAECGRQYEAGGAAAVSVLTDAPYFKGRLGDLVQVRAAVGLPVLRKEFIIHPYQVLESRAAGADAVLLIARILAPALLKELLDQVHEWGMDALVEIHTPEDYAAADAAGASLIGINNRNLATFATDLNTAMDLAAMLHPGQVPVAASGINDRRDIERNLSHGIFNFLIGESLVRAGDRTAFLRSLLD
jgi:indole-3-glycerol phosphate synthase